MASALHWRPRCVPASKRFPVEAYCRQHLHSRAVVCGGVVHAKQLRETPFTVVRASPARRLIRKHACRSAQRSHVAVETDIAATVSLEQHDETSLPDAWDNADLRVARAFGDAWIREQRTAVLVVPSVVVRREGNVLINPRHSDFSGIVASAPEPVVWDARLFGSN